MLLTRAPLYLPLRAFAFDLHVLGTPPALILSQDQTLMLNALVVRSAKASRYEEREVPRQRIARAFRRAEQHNF